MQTRQQQQKKQVDNFLFFLDFSSTSLSYVVCKQYRRHIGEWNSFAHSAAKTFPLGIKMARSKSSKNVNHLEIV